MRKNKKGMSIAAVLGIMICLVSAVTTCFVLAIRSSILTSRSLKYIESYNNASSEIDNAISFIESETNTKFKNGSISGSFVTSMCDSVEGLFGVETQTNVTNSEDSLDMKIGFVITIKSEYVRVNTQTDYLISIVNFASTTTGGKSVITSDLAFDKLTEVELKDMIKTRYNSTNLLWNYWSEQRAGLSYDRGKCKNELIATLGTDFVLTNILADINNWFASSDDYDITTQMTATRLIELIYNGIELQSSSFNLITWLKGEGFYTVNDFSDLLNTSGYLDFLKVDSQGNKAIVIDKNINVNNSANYVDKNIPIYITDNAVVVLRGGFTTNSNIYVERGASLIVRGNFQMTEYTNSSGAKVAPILDTDYVTSSIIAKEESGGPFVGGGLFVKGDLKYEAVDSGGVVLSDSRYDYYSKTYKTCDAYVNGNYTASGKVGILYHKEATNSTNGKISVGATIYCDDEASISNIGFASTTKAVRPFLLFCNGQLNVKYCSSLIDGKTVAYTNDSSWDAVADKKIGFAIITCEKVTALKGSPDLIFMNMFYNNTSEANNDKSDVNLLDATKDMQGGASAYAKYGIYNGFVNNNALANCSDNIEADSIHWYIPTKLRGSMVAASISASEAKKS